MKKTSLGEVGRIEECRRKRIGRRNKSKGIGIGMRAIVVYYRKRKEMFALFHQEPMAAIEKGIELPPLPAEFFAEDGKVRSSHARLLSGLVWLFIGLSLMIALYFKLRTPRCSP